MYTPNIPNITVSDVFAVTVLIAEVAGLFPEVPEGVLEAAVQTGGHVGAFDFTGALGQAVDSGLILKQQNPGRYSASDKARKLAAEFSAAVPASVREKVIAEAKRLYRLYDLRRTFRWGVVKEPHEDGDRYFFFAELLNEGEPETSLSEPVFSLKLSACDRKTAELMEENFLRDPAEIAGKIIKLFTAS